MNNKCCNGSDRAFVPVNANWDFNMDRDACPQRRSCGANACTREQEPCQTRTRTVCSACGQTPCVCQNRTRTVDCGCENQARTRTACSACGQMPCVCQNRTRTIDCGCEAASCDGQRQSRNIACVREARSGGQKSCSLPAMVKVDTQELGEIYQAEAALKAGTLFPELHKPMCGYSPAGRACGDACQAESFMLWELRLYLNTHPCDKEAMALFRHLQESCSEPSYATAFLTDGSCAAWGWTTNPWPWEYEANGCNCVKEGHGHVCV